MKKGNTICCFVLLPVILISTQLNSGVKDRRNLLQDLYDVKYYDLDIKIDHENKTIQGSVLCESEVLNTLDTLVFNLDNRLQTDSVMIGMEAVNMTEAAFEHSNDLIKIVLADSIIQGERIFSRIFYHGVPMEAWFEGMPGFYWQKTSENKPWIALECEKSGAYIWWPCKDELYDEPDSVSLHFTVPNPLICVSNGKFNGSISNPDSTTTFNWMVSESINNYNVTFYAAEFDLIHREYSSISGDDISFDFWVIPENYDKAVSQLGVFKTEFDFLEYVSGPFPFYFEKHGWANSPYYGMEHQTIIAYGSNFSVNSWGYDYIHLHELAHEWWGNFVTAKDWNDIWIHEGLATYMEALYIENISGTAKYHDFINSKRPEDNHIYPLAPREPTSAGEALEYSDPYYRGAWVVHTLRHRLGDEKFFELLKRWLYPDPADLDNLYGRQCRIVSTEDMKNAAEIITGNELDPFFDVFFREIKYPYLYIIRSENNAIFNWNTETDISLDLNVPVKINGIACTVEMSSGTGQIELMSTDMLEIDPEKWILMAEPVIESSIDEDELSVPYITKLYQNYPNPFNPVTQIRFALAKTADVKLRVYNINGQLVSQLLSGTMNAGYHTFDFDGSELNSGLYYYSLTTGGKTITKKMILSK